MSSTEFPNPTPLIDAPTLFAQLQDPALRILDTTVQMAGKPGGGYSIASGRDAYRAAHLPGAGFIDVLESLSDTGHRLRFMMPTEEQFVREMSAVGVGPDSRVVLYNSGPSWWATRVWFMLREFGFDRAQVLDGGLEAWRHAGLPLSDAACAYPRAQFVPGPRRTVFVGKEAVLNAVRRRDSHLVNALSPDVFRGETVNYGRPGRIRGSVNVFARDLLDADTQRFRPAPVLRDRLASAGVLDGKPVIHYCGGGISATTDAFAMLLLGHDNVSIYDASMTEWGPDESLPMESG